ncbi:MAG: hypothetical protein E7291_09440 [Lachnospiraceae bacterium]|nr:hypothetical protein [Lachnospiraceae bacterium]
MRLRKVNKVTADARKRKACGAVLMGTLLCAMLLAGCGVQDEALVLTLERDEQADALEAEKALQSDLVEEVSEQKIFVHVCGAVKRPGVVELPPESRASDALEAAGGLLAEAQPDYVNLAARLEDAQQLYFPTREEAKLLREEQEEVAEDLVNINTAGIEQLCTLPGIGEARAADIVAYREARGAFPNKEAIMEVSGIKQSVYEKLCDRISVN